MIKSCSLLPMLIGAGVFPLFAHALETVELNLPDGRPMLVAEASALRAQSRVPTFTYGGAAVDVTFTGARSRSIFQFPLAEPAGDFLGFAASEVTSVLEEIRLATPRQTAPASTSAAQFAAALALAGLVARRRLAGR